MAYEMLSGELPFDAKTPWQWAAAHVDQPPRPLSEHAVGAGPACAQPRRGDARVEQGPGAAPGRRRCAAARVPRSGRRAARGDRAVARASRRRNRARDDAAPPTAVTQREHATARARRARLDAAPAIALALVAAIALVAVLRHRAAVQAHAAARPTMTRPRDAAAVDPIESKRARGAQPSCAAIAQGVRAQPARDELSALAARADRLHAIGDRSEARCRQMAAESTDPWPKRAPRSSAASWAPRPRSLAAAARTPGVDTAAIAGLICALSEMRSNSAQTTSQPRAIAPDRRRLAEQLQIGLDRGSNGARRGRWKPAENTKSSPADAGPSPSSAELAMP